MPTSIKIQTKRYKSEGDLSWEYNAFHNIIDADKKPDDSDKHALSDFTVGDLNLDMEHPVEVEVQPSYDGSVNLILNDDHDVPRIINSAFTVQEGWKYKRVERNQQVQTNYYPKEKVSENTQLFRTTSTCLHVALTDVEDGGELKGGNYIFYFKYGDEDFNETDWIGESGIVSIYHGFPTKIKDVRGTLLDEKTSHQITLELTGVDTAFSKLYVYAKRSYADLNGVLTDEYFKLSKPFDITSKTFSITITGLEQSHSVSSDIFNISYNVYDAVATSTQVQNRLFFGNVKEIVPDHNTLANCALNIEVSSLQDKSVGNVTSHYTASAATSAEYYNALNIYYYLGYWPGELYRLAVVYIYDNDTLSDAYNLKGCCFETLNESNRIPGEGSSFNTYDLNEVFINGESKYNTKGVFQMPDINLLGSSEVQPLGFKMTVPTSVCEKLRGLKIKGLFFVRQARIPIALAQGASIGISEQAHIPVLSNRENKTTVYIAEGLIKDNNLERHVLKSKGGDDGWKANPWALLCQDVNLNKQLQSMFDGSQFILKPSYRYTLLNNDSLNRKYAMSRISEEVSKDTKSLKLAYIAPETPSRILENRYFSSKAGSESELLTLRNLRWGVVKKYKDKRPIDDYTIRGNFAGYLGVIDGEVDPNTVYTIYTSSYIDTPIKRKTQVELRALDANVFTPISQRVELHKDGLTENVYGGDCFTCTTSIKMCYNFLDYSTPLNDKIVKQSIKPKETASGWDNYDNWKVSEQNLSDWNTVSIGHYVTYKCMSNFNLGIRCLNDQYTDERALFGDLRSFYPYSEHTYGVSFKIPESTLFNAGNSTTMGARHFFAPNKVPFIKEFFDNRIAFSNIQSVDSFQNNYRVFSGLSYTDVERKYGAIVKLLPLGVNLFCVFEHGCGIVPINEKALMSTTTGQSIHLYGADVVQPQVTVISPDYGSTWEESIIVTPGGIYGVDTFAKKIWRYSAEGFAIISDMLVQRFLNDNINLTDYDQNEIVGYKNVKTHYNNYKGDVMFTFYNKDKEWNLCYNERIQKWTTRYSWIPAYSANIYNSFVSIDKKPMKQYAELDIVASNTGDLIADGDTSLKYRNRNDESIEYEASILFKVANAETFDRLVEENNPDGPREEQYYSIVPKINSVHLYRNQEAETFYESSEDPIKIYEEELSTGENAGKIESSKIIWCIPSTNVGDTVYWQYPKGHILGIRSSEEIQVTEDWDITDHIKTLFTSYVWVQTRNDILVNIRLVGDFANIQKILHRANLDFSYDIYKHHEYWKATDGSVSELDQEESYVIRNGGGRKSLPIIISENGLPSELKDAIQDINRIQFYTHGRAGNYTELNYFDKDLANQIQPTKWYGKQEPFEFEFVVNSAMGQQKIFNNINIISNRAEPDSIECTLIGDSYLFKKDIEEGNYNFNVKFDIDKGKNITFVTNISKDQILNQNTLTTCSKLRNLEGYGRRLGNMQYLEDKWSITLDPIYYQTTQDSVTKTNSARLRDKWLKIRVKYKGDKLAVVSAIQSLFTMSFA